jgi:hypothetical protein
MPDEGSTRYEQHDRPGFVAELKKVCAGCTVLYNNADGDASKQLASSPVRGGSPELSDPQVFRIRAKLLLNWILRGRAWLI